MTGLNVQQSAVVGALAGTIEVLIQQPTIAWKNATQFNKPLSFAPSSLYRGVSINALSIAPITALQFSTYTLGTQLTTSNTPATQISIAAFAGFMSSLVATPAERVMIQQQRSGQSLIQSLRLVRAHAPMRGIRLAAARDAIFAGGYLALAPVLSTAIAEQPDAMQRAAGAISAGLIAGVCSHPFDTMKTVVQAAAPGTLAPLSTISLRGMFAGLLPRSLRIIGAFIILQESKVRLEPLLFS